jgi:hypothetical protein
MWQCGVVAIEHEPERSLRPGQVQAAEDAGNADALVVTVVIRRPEWPADPVRVQVATVSSAAITGR